MSSVKSTFVYLGSGRKHSGWGHGGGWGRGWGHGGGWGHGWGHGGGWGHGWGCKH